ncbi:MAG: SDR family oxidoreductase [Gammaproteobacteria bacterium]|nr:SDR family oxidoreductase [Gammaproteobacteria bacterium]MBP6051062.1 SDR family oxidoreductase [Pseudomonadales bacterium]MBK6584166.1 SDR family oxidoreductase [Gammaproteobacteria bacterium]MBK7168585.1 SDR family oxidoreductase [Gammaproteobacteria bacterium]MBK7520350.1 SDR family oxidoreductase [Gammaproteobacteria bacterium]
MAVFAMTGGATGIGAAIRDRIQARGDRMIVADIRDAEVVADLGTAEGRRAAVAGIRAAAPEGLDGFVACAGLGPNVDPPSRVARVNYFGAVEVIEGLRDALAARAASVVVISSNSAPMSADAAFVDLLLAGDEEGAAVHVDKCDGQVAYAGSKMGVARWVRGNAPAWAKEGVRLNAVAPGIVNTALSTGVAADQRYGAAMQAFAATVPVGYIGEPCDVAAAVDFLLGAESRFVCGSILFVDGGHDALLRPAQF